MVRLPVGRLTAVVAVLVAAFFAMHGHSGPRFRTLRHGIEFATMRGDPYCRRGSSQIAVVRVDPARARVGVRHFSREPEGRPLDILEWQKRTSAVAVFNAGQYYPDRSYMGLLVCGGEVVSSRPHPQFKAALVAEPASGAAAARVLDLHTDTLDPERPGWSEVAQSFMLFDRNRAFRVRRSTVVANRTAVAEDHDGRLLIFTTEGGYTLYDFARLLRDERLRLVHAMSMDGGLEAELCVKSPGFRYASFGPWKGDGAATSAVGAHVPLPTVITVTAR